MRVASGSTLDKSSRRKSIVAIGSALAIALLAAGPARAEADDARAILKSMADYVTAQKSISAKFDSDIEVITPELQKIQFSSSGNFVLSRPDRLRVQRTGGYADVELVFDGKTATIYGKNLNAFAQFDAPGSTDQLIDRLRSELSVDAPGADFFLTHLYDELTQDVIDAHHIGRGVVDGTECEHLAFRNPDTDWQIWVEVGPQPIPRKYVITSKTVTGAPQYTLRISDWKTEPAAADAFSFKQPADAKKVDFKELANLDEVPPGVVVGEKK